MSHNLSFELPTIKRKQQAIDYIKEFHQYNSAINGTGGLDIDDYENWLVKTIDAHNGIVRRKDRVPASTYFVIDENNEIIGMVNIRHILNEYLETSGSGHIGYSVRPTERRKGYATSILKEALSILKNQFNVSNAMVGCYEENIGSKKTIINNGGILQRKVQEENQKVTLVFDIEIK